MHFYLRSNPCWTDCLRSNSLWTDGLLLLTLSNPALRAGLGSVFSFISLMTSAPVPALPSDYLDWLFQDPKGYLQDLNFLYADTREDDERPIDDFDSVDYDRLAMASPQIPS